MKGIYILQSGRCCSFRRLALSAACILLIWSIAALAVFIKINTTLSDLWFLPVVPFEVIEDTLFCNLLLIIFAFHILLSIVLIYGICKKSLTSILIWIVVTILMYVVRLALAVLAFVTYHLTFAYKINAFIVLEFICVCIVYCYYRELNKAITENRVKNQSKAAGQAPNTNELPEENGTKHVTYCDSVKVIKSYNEDAQEDAQVDAQEDVQEDAQEAAQEGAQEDAQKDQFEEAALQTIALKPATLEPEPVVVEMLVSEKDSRKMSMQDIKNDRMALKEWFSENFPSANNSTPSPAHCENIFIVSPLIVNGILENQVFLNETSAEPLETKSPEIEIEATSKEEQSQISSEEERNFDYDKKLNVREQILLGNTVKQIVYNINNRKFEEQREGEAYINKTSSKEDMTVQSSPYNKKKFLQPPLTPHAKRISRDENISDEPKHEFINQDNRAIVMDQPSDEKKASENQSHVQINEVEVEEQIYHMDKEDRHEVACNISIEGNQQHHFIHDDFQQNSTTDETHDSDLSEIVSHTPTTYCTEMTLHTDSDLTNECWQTNPQVSVDTNVICIDMVKPLDDENILHQHLHAYHSEYSTSGYEELQDAFGSQLIHTNATESNATESNATESNATDVCPTHAHTTDNFGILGLLTDKHASVLQEPDLQVTAIHVSIDVDKFYETKTHANHAHVNHINAADINSADTKAADIYDTDVHLADTNATDGHATDVSLNKSEQPITVNSKPETQNGTVEAMLDGDSSIQQYELDKKHISTEHKKRIDGMRKRSTSNAK